MGTGLASPPPQALLCCTGLSAVRVSRAELPRPLGSHRPELLPPAALLRPPKLAKKQQHTHSETFQRFINQILQKSLSVFREGGGAAWPGPTRGWVCGGPGSRGLPTPVPACEFGLWLMCKNKIWRDWQGHSVKGWQHPLRTSVPQIWEPPVARRERGSQTGPALAADASVGPAPGCWSRGLGVGPGPMGLAESQPEPQDQRLWSPGPRGATGQGRRPQPRALGKLRQERTVAQWPGARGAQAGA